VPARTQSAFGRAAGALVTGPIAFLVSGLIDVAHALGLALRHAVRSTIR
jgi:hypothetical protein